MSTELGGGYTCTVFNDREGRYVRPETVRRIKSEAKLEAKSRRVERKKQHQERLRHLLSGELID